MAQAPTALPRHPRVYEGVRTTDPLRLLTADSPSPWAGEAKLLYSDSHVHPLLLDLVTRESSGDAFDVESYRHSESVNLGETTPEQLRSFPLKVLFGALNSRTGYMSNRNALCSCFKVVLFGTNSYRNFFFYSEREYQVKMMNLGTLRSIAPSLRNREAKCKFEFHERSISVPIEIEAILHGDRRMVSAELARRFVQVELTLYHTLNGVLCRAIANPPSVLDDYLSTQLERYKAVSNGKDPAPSRWLHDILTKQMEGFCSCQFKTVDKTRPIRDCLSRIRINVAEGRGGGGDGGEPEFFAFVSAPVADIIADGDLTTPPRSVLYMYPELEDEGNSGESKPVSTSLFKVYEGLDKKVSLQLPYVLVEGMKVPIVKVPHEEGKLSPFESTVALILTAPLGYVKGCQPRVEDFYNVDLSKVRVTCFRRAGCDAEFDFVRDVVQKSGLYHPLVYDPGLYERVLRGALSGTESEAFSVYFNDGDFHRKALSSEGIRPTDREFVYCVSPHVLYVGTSFGTTVGDTLALPTVPTCDSCTFRLVGIEGNRTLCSADGYLEAACTVAATTNQIDETVERTFLPFLEECLAAPLAGAEDVNVAITLLHEPDMQRLLMEAAAEPTLMPPTVQDERIGGMYRRVLVDLFRSRGACKWMQFPRLLVALLKMASLDVFDYAFRDRLELAVLEIDAISTLPQEAVFITVEKLKIVERGIRRFASSILGVFHSGESNVKPFSFCDLPCVLPTHHIPYGDRTPKRCDADVDQTELMVWRFTTETVLNFLATNMYAWSGSTRNDFYLYSHQVNVGSGNRRVEWHRQPYWVDAFLTTATYDAREMNDRLLKRVTDDHPLLSCHCNCIGQGDGGSGGRRGGRARRRGGSRIDQSDDSGGASDRHSDAAAADSYDRLQNFYHSTVSRIFRDLAAKKNLSMAIRCLAAAMCLRVHAPENAAAVPRGVLTHSSCSIVRHGEFRTHKLVLAKMDGGDDLENGFIGMNPPCVVWDKSANGSLTARIVARMGPVMPKKRLNMRQVPHYCTTECSRGMGSDMADIHAFLDGRRILRKEFWMDDAFAVPTPSAFGADPFDTNVYPVNGRFGTNLSAGAILGEGGSGGAVGGLTSAGIARLQQHCAVPDPFHVVSGAYSYNPFADSRTPSLMMVLNYLLASKRAPQLPPWRKDVDRFATHSFALKKRFEAIRAARAKEIRVDTMEDPGNPEVHVDWSADSFLAQRGRFYHPGSSGNPLCLGEKGRSVLGEDENSTLNWSQLLHPEFHSVRTAVRPLEERGVFLSQLTNPYRPGLVR